MEFMYSMLDSPGSRPCTSKPTTCWSTRWEASGSREGSERLGQRLTKGVLNETILSVVP